MPNFLLQLYNNKVANSENPDTRCLNRNKPGNWKERIFFEFTDHCTLYSFY